VIIIKLNFDQLVILKVTLLINYWSDTTGTCRITPTQCYIFFLSVSLSKWKKKKKNPKVKVKDFLMLFISFFFSSFLQTKVDF
jgi:hypothetical protein